MSTENLVIGLMVAYFLCAYFVAYKFTRLVCVAENVSYEFKIKWYHKAAGTYVLALPIFLLLSYLISRVTA